MTWALVVVIVALLAEKAWNVRVTLEERRRLVNAVLARNAPEAALLERAAMKPSPIKRKPLTDPDVGDPEDYVLIGTNGL